MGEVYGRDQHGHIWVRKSGGDNGCLYGLLAIGVVVIAIIALIIYGISSLLNSVGLATGVIKPTPTPIPPWSISLSLDSAQHYGNFASNAPDAYYGFVGAPDPNGMRSGSTLTFSGIDAPRNGTYTLYFEIRVEYEQTAPSYILDIIVNGQTVTQQPLDTSGDAPYQVKINLQQGNNTLVLKLEGNDTTDQPWNYASFVKIKMIDLQN